MVFGSLIVRCVGNEDERYTMTLMMISLTGTPMLSVVDMACYARSLPTLSFCKAFLRTSLGCNAYHICYMMLVILGNKQGLTQSRRTVMSGLRDSGNGVSSICVVFAIFQPLIGDPDISMNPNIQSCPVVGRKGMLLSSLMTYGGQSSWPMAQNKADI
jgi:hypothetical protein